MISLIHDHAKIAPLFLTNALFPSTSHIKRVPDARPHGWVFPFPFLQAQGAPPPPPAKKKLVILTTQNRQRKKLSSDMITYKLVHSEIDFISRAIPARLRLANRPKIPAPWTIPEHFASQLQQGC